MQIKYIITLISVNSNEWNLKVLYILIVIQRNHFILIIWLQTTKQNNTVQVALSAQ